MEFLIACVFLFSFLVIAVTAIFLLDFIIYSFTKKSFLFALEQWLFK